MNTKFVYLYRDACNYKTFEEVVIQGPLRLEDIKPFLRDGQFFIPSEVGLHDLQDEVFTTDDHIWHEINEIRNTEEQPTIELDASILINNFKKAFYNDWNEANVFKRKGLM